MSTSELLQLRDLFLAKLEGEQAKRKFKQPADWISAERKVMVEYVNGERVRRGLPLIGLDLMVRLDNTCTGHDYSAKLALRCAELAMGIGSFQPAR